MPTERDALDVLFQAGQRLQELGWQDIAYCPKDGSEFEVIEFGSTGIHPCIYVGTWPDGAWWVFSEDGDSASSHPVLFRLPPAPDGANQGA